MEPYPELAKEMAALATRWADAKVVLDTLWVLASAALVFLMNVGLAWMGFGFRRAKNGAPVLAKNFAVFAAASLAFWALGWGVMFGDGTPLTGVKGLFFLSGLDKSPDTQSYLGVYSAIRWTGVPLMAKFFFHALLAGTAATLVAGAMAERIRYESFALFTFILAGGIYPIIGHWIWGGGWLAKLGMFDAAGSTVVHSVGGWAALAGILLMGHRFGKGEREGLVNPVPEDSAAAATLGALLAWLGWFGFNAGSTMAAVPRDIARICMTTNTAAAAALLTSTIASACILRKPDLGLSIKGCLAGLVAIAAPCAYVSLPSSALIGAVSGVTLVLAASFLNKMRVDDPAGALAVHLAHGILGTAAVGLFAQKELAPQITGNGLFFGGGSHLLFTQLTGIVTVGAFAFFASLIAWALIRATIGMRVPAEEA